MARALYADKHNSINEICNTLNISKTSLYRYLKTGGGRSSILESISPCGSVPVMCEKGATSPVVGEFVCRDSL